MLHALLLINLQLALLFLLLSANWISMSVEIISLEHEKQNAIRRLLEDTIETWSAEDAGEVGGTYHFHLEAGASPYLTWHHAVEGDGALADEVLADGVMIPHEEAHQGQLRHVNCEHQSLLPHRVEP